MNTLRSFFSCFITFFCMRKFLIIIILLDSVIFSQEWVSTLVDSSKNGYGAYLETPNPLAYSYDNGWVAVYRQWGGLDATSGYIGVAQSADGGNWFVEQQINTEYPEGVEEPDLPTATGTPQGRYPSAAVSSVDNKPIAIWNEYTNSSSGGGTYGGRPMFAYDSYNIGENSNFGSVFNLNNGCSTFPCDPPDLWNGNVVSLDGDDGSHKVLASYNSWAGGTDNYMIRSLAIYDGYISPADPYIFTDYANETDDNGNCLWYECTGYTGTADFHINNEGVGYAANTSWTANSDFEEPFLHTIFFKKTEDYGETWTSDDGYMNSGYYYLSDAEMIRLSDSLYTLWSNNTDLYPDMPWYPWAECTDEYGVTYTCGDTITYDDSEDYYFFTPGWFIHYAYDMITDQDGGFHFVAPNIPFVCHDLDGGCQDSDGDGLADSLYWENRMGGAGMMHFYNPDPIESPNAWTATLIQDFSDAYFADWTASDIPIMNDAIYYFYPQISPSIEEGSSVIWYGAFNMSEGNFDADELIYIPSDIDIYMAKSTNMGLTWSVPENVTNTPGGIFPDKELEVGVHLANVGKDDQIGVFYQVPEFNVETYPPAGGYEDYMNRVFVGIYGNTDFEIYSGPIWYVSTSGSDYNDGSDNAPFATIQKGIDESSNGDTVLVAEGTYTENINYNGKNIVVGSLFLTTGDTSYIASTIIDGSSSGSVVKFENEEDSSCILAGFTIQNGYTDFVGGGIYCSESSPTITHSVITSNVVDWYGGGVYCERSNLTMSNVVISNNEAQQGSAIKFENSSNNPSILTFNNVTVSNNFVGDENNGVIQGGGADLIFVSSILWNDQSQEIVNEDGDVSVSYSAVQGAWPGYGNISSNPNFCDVDSNDYMLAENSPCVGTGQDGTNMGAYGVGCGIIDLKIYVSNTGSDETGDGSEENPFGSIQAGIDAAGQGDSVFVQQGTYLENVILNKKDVVVIGENKDSTIVDGQNLGSVFTLENPTYNNEDVCTIENFTIQNGFAFGGGGIHVAYFSPQLINLNVINNNAGNEGGGIQCSNGDPTFDGLFISGNHAGSGGGIYLEGQAHLTISSSTIVNNSANGYGGGIQVHHVSVAEFTNCILWNNSTEWNGYQQAHVASGTLTINYCDIQGGEYAVENEDIGFVNWGDGNFNANPLFCDPLDGDYTLAENSPCIGAGDNEDNIGAYGLGCGFIYNGPVWYVDIEGSDTEGDGSGEYPFGTIQYAIDLIPDGDTILVAAGNYNESITLVESNIEIMGDNQQDVIINGQIYLQNSQTGLSGFTVNNESGNGIVITSYENDENAYPTLDSVIVNNCLGNGIEIQDSNPTLTNITVIENLGHGIWCSNSAPLFDHITVSDNSLSSVMSNNSEITITNSIVWNTIDANIQMENDGQINITYSDIQGGWEGEGNIDSAPLFCDPAIDIYFLSENSPCVGSGAEGVNMGTFGTGCELPVMTLFDDNFDVYGNSGTLNIFNNDYNIDFGSIDSIEIMDVSDNASIQLNDDNSMQYETSEGHYGSDAFSYTIHYGDQNDTAQVEIYVYLSNTVTSYPTTGQIEGGLTMLDNSSLYAVSSNDAVYRFDSNLNFYYNLEVNGEINSASTITNDHRVYIASTDNNLYSFNASGVTNPNWPRAMGSEVTASVTLDNSGNIYVGTNNGIFQAITPNNETIWSYNCSAPIYSSAAISSENKIFICTSDGRIICFDLTTLDPALPSFDWLLPTGSDIMSSPALDGDGNIYIGLMDGRLIKIDDAGSSGSIVWEVYTGEGITASPIIDAAGNIYIGSADGTFYNFSPDGQIIWSTELGSELHSTAAIDGNGNLYVGSNSSGSDITGERSVSANLYCLDSTGVLFSKFTSDASIISPILLSGNEIFFGDTSGIVYKMILDTNRTSRDQYQAMWGTFQGNNQRTGNQSDINLGIVSDNSVIPKEFALHQNYPNPFNPVTTLRYDLPEDAMVNITIYDLMGRVVSTLVNMEQTAGYRSIRWNAANDLGQPVSAGMYLYMIQAGDFRQTKKMVLLK